MKGMLLAMLGAGLIAGAGAHAGTVDLRPIGESVGGADTGMSRAVAAERGPAFGMNSAAPCKVVVDAKEGREPRALADVSGMGAVIVLVPMATSGTRSDSFVSLSPRFSGAPSTGVQIDEWLSRKHVPLPSAGLAGFVTLGGIVLARHRRMRTEGCTG